MKNKGMSANYLDYIPYHNPKLDSEVDETGKVTLLQEHKGVFYFLTQKLLGKPRISKIHLDEMGSFIWQLIDGERSVMQISVLVREKFGESAEPLYNRLVTYMASLESCGFIKMNKD